MIPGFQDSKWPSLLLQGMLLASNLWFITQHSNDLNPWIFGSILYLLTLISLQSTGIGFLYLYPVRGNKPTVGIDTWILRLIIMFSGFCLYMGILDAYPNWIDSWLIVLIVLGIIFILILPIIFNAGLSDYLRNRAVKKSINTDKRNN